MYTIDVKNSPNQGSRNGHIPLMIVNHITEGSYSGAVNWLMNPKSQASSHFVVSRKGLITQLVPIERMAWCNGTSTNPTSNVYFGNAKNESVKKLGGNANWYSVSIEHEAYSSDKGSLYPEQLEATIWLHKHIVSEVKKIYNTDIKDIIGHSDINPITKPNCPGANFPLKLIRDNVNSDWKNEIGLKALNELVSKGFINNPKYWEDKLNDKLEVWTVFELMTRLINRFED